MEKYAGVIFVTVESDKAPVIAIQLQEIFGFNDKVRRSGDQIVIWTDWMCLRALMGFVERVELIPAVIETKILISVD